MVVSVRGTNLTDEGKFNVQINHPMYSIHYVAENVSRDEAIQVAEKYVGYYGGCAVFFEMVYLDQNGYTICHSSMTYKRFLELKTQMIQGAN